MLLQPFTVTNVYQSLSNIKHVKS